MEFVVATILGVLLDPVVLVGAAVVVALLASGVAARVVEALQDARQTGTARAQAGAMRVNGNS